MCASNSAKGRYGKSWEKVRLIHKRSGRASCGSRSPAGTELRRWRLSPYERCQALFGRFIWKVDHIR